MTVVSHPGATYGGLVHDGSVNGDRTRDALAQVREHYAAQGLERLRYDAVPHIYHRSPSQDDIWALAELGATLVRSRPVLCDRPGELGVSRPSAAAAASPGRGSGA